MSKPITFGLVALIVSFLWALSANRNAPSYSKVPAFVETLQPAPPNITYLNDSRIVVADFAHEFYDYHASSRAIAWAQLMTQILTFGQKRLIYAPYAAFERMIRQVDGEYSDCVVTIASLKYNEYSTHNSVLGVYFECDLDATCDFEQIKRTGKIEPPCEHRYVKMTAFRMDDFFLGGDGRDYTDIHRGYVSTAHALFSLVVFASCVIAVAIIATVTFFVRW
ncbi:MAG: hypothetical protein WC763_06690 [Candidatus Paceibacterota bacterium]|jgi:hypothetical protein